MTMLDRNGEAHDRICFALELRDFLAEKNIRIERWPTDEEIEAAEAEIDEMVPHPDVEDPMLDAGDLIGALELRWALQQEAREPRRVNLEELLDEFFGIDRRQLEVERRELLATIKGDAGPQTDAASRRMLGETV